MVNEAHKSVLVDYGNFESVQGQAKLTKSLISKFYESVVLLIVA